MSLLAMCQPNVFLYGRGAGTRTRNSATVKNRLTDVLAIYLLAEEREWNRTTRDKNPRQRVFFQLKVHNCTTELALLQNLPDCLSSCQAFVGAFRARLSVVETPPRHTWSKDWNGCV